MHTTTPAPDRPPVDHPRAPGRGVRRATRADAGVLSRTLASAFRDDPVFSWCLPDARLRHRHLGPWFQVVVDALLEHEETYCTEDGAGAALWVPPGVPAMTQEQGDRLGAVTAEMGVDALRRTAELTSVMEAAHPHAPHLYLWFAGVRASRQGHGWGGRLLESRLSRADAQAVPAYLEATNERNRRLYERHGFEVTGVLTVDGSPPLWQMRREPRP
jgi:ribosomal protein S18 acetylase RimI-like enzyme